MQDGKALRWQRSFGALLFPWAFDRSQLPLDRGHAMVLRLLWVCVFALVAVHAIESPKRLFAPVLLFFLICLDLVRAHREHRQPTTRTAVGIVCACVAFLEPGVGFNNLSTLIELVAGQRPAMANLLLILVCATLVVALSTVWYRAARALAGDQIAMPSQRPT